MTKQHSTPEDPWEGLEPLEPAETSGRNTVLIVGILAAALCVLGVILIGVYLLLSNSGPDVNATPIVVPTLPGTGTPTAGAAADNILTPTSALAPTVTLPGNVPAATLVPTTAPPVQVVSSRLTTAPAIDGSLADWPALPTYRSAFTVFTADSWDGTDDVDATWRLGWDDSNLYVAAEVTDNLHVQTQVGNQIWKGDGVDLQLDANRSNDAAGLNLDNFQINLSPGNFSDIPPSAFRFQGTADGNILDAPGGHHVTVAAQKTATGYIIEAAIPWSDLNFTPSVGAVLGLALNVNGNDQAGQAVQEVMKSHVSTRTLTRPTGWGTMVLQ